MTRAKYRAWIVGDMDTLSGGQAKGNVWRGLLAFAKLRGWVVPVAPKPQRPTAEVPEQPLGTPPDWFGPSMAAEWQAESMNQKAPCQGAAALGIHGREACGWLLAALLSLV